MVTGLPWEPDESHGVYSGQSVDATPCGLPHWQAVARNDMERRVAGGSRPEGVDFARIDPPEFFSVPAAPFLAGRNAATFGDSIIFGVAGGPRGNPWGPVGTRDP